MILAYKLKTKPYLGFIMTTVAGLVFRLGLDRAVCRQKYLAFKAAKASQGHF